MFIKLGYAGAILATLEGGNDLPARAYAFEVGPEIIAQIREEAEGNLNSTEATLYLNDETIQK